MRYSLHRREKTHPYLGASPSCWGLYGEVLAREFGDPEYMKVHRLTVDAYCAQHPGFPERRTIQSINVHLVGLYVTMEKRLSGDFACKVIGKVVVDSQSDFQWMLPPKDLGSITVADVIDASDAEAHRIAVQDWARSVWTAWAPEHGHVARMAEAAVRRL